jgi:hypothetical protein
MSKLIEVAKQILMSCEIAAEDISVAEGPSAEEQYISYLQAVIIRANQYLDKDKGRIFAEVLALPTKGSIERAIIAYDRYYLMQLGLSLESTCELAKELCLVAKQGKVGIPKDWKAISEMDIVLSNPTVGIMNRKKPVV